MILKGLLGVGVFRVRREIRIGKLGERKLRGVGLGYERFGV